MTGGDQRRDAEEHHHLDQAVDQVADQLGETDHVDLDLGVSLAATVLSSVLASSYFVAELLFEHLRQAVVVDALAGGRLLVQQRHDDHARLEVAGHQAADDAARGDVLPQLFDVCGEPW